MKTIDKKEFSVLLTKVEEETNFNCHSKAYKMVADFFGYQEYSEILESYVNKDSLSSDEYYTRCEIAERMLIIIGVEYGKNVAKEIEKVL